MQKASEIGNSAWVIPSDLVTLALVATVRRQLQAIEWGWVGTNLSHALLRWPWDEYWNARNVSPSCFSPRGSGLRFQIDTVYCWKWQERSAKFFSMLWWQFLVQMSSFWRSPCGLSEMIASHRQDGAGAKYTKAQVVILIRQSHRFLQRFIDSYSWVRWALPIDWRTALHSYQRY